MKVRPFKRSAHYGFYGSSPSETADGRQEPEEQPAGGCPGPVVDQVECDGFPDLVQKGKAVDDVSLSSDNDLSRPPANIVKIEGRHLARTEPETSEEKQDRVIAPSGRSLQIAYVEQLLHVCRCKVTRNTGKPRCPGGEDGGRQV
jgi:hypothetical protein